MEREIFGVFFGRRPADERSNGFESGGKPHALQTLRECRAVWDSSNVWGRNICG